MRLRSALAMGAARHSSMWETLWGYASDGEGNRPAFAALAGRAWTVPREPTARACGCSAMSAIFDVM